MLASTSDTLRFPWDWGVVLQRAQVGATVADGDSVTADTSDALDAGGGLCGH